MADKYAAIRANLERAKGECTFSAAFIRGEDDDLRAAILLAELACTQVLHAIDARLAD